MENLKKFFNELLKIRWMLVIYDIAAFVAVELFLSAMLYLFANDTAYLTLFRQSALALGCVLVCRLLGKIYRQIWRYGGIQCYLRLLLTDVASLLLYLTMAVICSVEPIAFTEVAALILMNDVLSMGMRMVYRYAYKYGDRESRMGRILVWLLIVFAGMRPDDKDTSQKIKIAIIGAGRVGVSLAEELLNNENSAYSPRCFVDINKGKSGREIHGIPVLSEEEATFGRLNEFEIQEVVLALPTLDNEIKKQLYEHYKKLGYKVKVYDYPTMETAGKKRQLREFDVEELLFRKPIVVSDERTNEYYIDKANDLRGSNDLTMDSFEDIAVAIHTVQQELKIKYGNSLDLRIEIVSITNKVGLERVFDRYRPQIVINAAAHKHVPLMEHNCIEAVENNVFGTQNMIDLCEKYEVERFMMVSTDKAVNPTNVMGATKRMCEMLVQSQSTHGKVKYSCTRFGNVLGSAGSVIPLFKRQIANGGPVTITDKRIIRYFMTIPEASQLVLQSGAMAKNGELFVLDMGKPVKILDLAENMIRLSGAKNIEIVETGLRPGEKLYEELLVKTEDLDKTDNRLIFIERDEPLNAPAIAEKMAILRAACQTGEDAAAKAALRQVVPTYRTPEEVNQKLPSNITDKAEDVVIEIRGNDRDNQGKQPPQSGKGRKSQRTGNGSNPKQNMRRAAVH